MNNFNASNQALQLQDTTLNTANRPSRRKDKNRHCFQPEIRRDVQQYHQLDNWHGPLMVIEDWSWILIAIAASLWAWKNSPALVAAGVYLLAASIIGARQRGLKVINHIGTHKALTKNKQLNYILSTLTAAWLTLESFSGYDDTHNSIANGHHANLGTERDVDHMAVVQQGLYGEHSTAKNVRLYLLSLPLRTPGYVMFLLKNRVWNSREESNERLKRLIYVSLLMAIILYLGWGWYLLLYWFVPLFTTAVWIGLFIQLAEHYPLMASGSETDIFLSRNRILNPLLNLFIGTHNEGYHLIHHLFPGLPFWQMKKTHRLLMQDETYASLHQTTGISALLQQLTPNT